MHFHRLGPDSLIERMHYSNARLIRGVNYGNLQTKIAPINSLLQVVNSEGIIQHGFCLYGLNIIATMENMDTMVFPASLTPCYTRSSISLDALALYKAQRHERGRKTESSPACILFRFALWK